VRHVNDLRRPDTHIGSFAKRWVQVAREREPYQMTLNQRIGPLSVPADLGVLGVPGVTPHQPFRYLFQPGSILIIKPVQTGTIQIKNTDQLALTNHRNHNL
jgi:hypothetical protein